MMKTKAEEKVSILFICLGNICRSPAAHAVMQHLVDERGWGDRYLIDSAGIGGWHVGQLPDKRMREWEGSVGIMSIIMLGSLMQAEILIVSIRLSLWTKITIVILRRKHRMRRPERRLFEWQTSSLSILQLLVFPTLIMVVQRISTSLLIW